MRKLIVLAAIALCIPAVTQAKTLEELLAEKGVITKAEAAGASAGGGARVSWNNGTRVEFPDNGFSLQIGTLLVTRYTYSDTDGGDNTSSFDITKARIIVQGTAVNKEFSYMLVPDFVGDSDDSGKKTPDLRDAYFTWNACDNAKLKMGQFKVPMSRQYLNSDSQLQFANRTVASDFFDLDRQAGLAAVFEPNEDWKFVAGIFNGNSSGEGRNRSGADTDHLLTAGLRWNVMGQMDPYSEGDVEWTDDTAVNVGAYYAFQEIDSSDDHRVSVDANVKSQGWSLHGEFYWQQFDLGDDEAEPMGWYAQVGYMLIAKELELAARYSMVDCDDGAAGGACSGNDDVSQAGASLNYFWWGHHMKAQLGYDFISEDPVSGDSVDANEWTLQLSGWF